MPVGLVMPIALLRAPVLPAVMVTTVLSLRLVTMATPMLVAVVMQTVLPPVRVRRVAMQRFVLK